MQIWQQNYDPLNNIWLSSLIALLPVLFFFFALIRLKMKGYQAATLTVVLALLVALLLYRMPLSRRWRQRFTVLCTACGPSPGSSWRRFLFIRSRLRQVSSTSSALPSYRSRPISAYRC
ncbi:L-lactate permease [Pantoea ananatis]